MPVLRKTLKAGALALFILTTSAAILTFLFSDRWRYQSDRPEKSDAIVVLAGDPTRAMYAAELYRLGYAPVVFVVRPAERAVPPEEEVNRRILRDNGVPERHLRTFAAGAANTLAEAGVAEAELPAGTKSVLVVTTQPHVRRVRMMFADKLRERGIRIAVAAPSADSDATARSTPEPSATRKVEEIAKAILYTLGIS